MRSLYLKMQDLKQNISQVKHDPPKLFYKYLLAVS